MNHVPGRVKNRVEPVFQPQPNTRDAPATDIVKYSFVYENEDKLGDEQLYITVRTNEGSDQPLKHVQVEYSHPDVGLHEFKESTVDGVVNDLTSFNWP